MATNDPIAAWQDCFRGATVWSAILHDRISGDERVALPTAAQRLCAIITRETARSGSPSRPG